MRTSCAGFHLGKVLPTRRSTEHCNPFRLARLAPLGFILELLIVEEQLFPGGEDEVGIAVDALQNPVLEFHWRCSLQPNLPGSLPNDD